MTNLDSILKSRDIPLPRKSHLVKAMVFPVVMSGCESWTINKVERWRIDAFELRCWRKPLRVPQTARRSNKSILKKISPRCSLEGLMLKLKLQYFGHLMWRVDALEKTLMLGGIGGKRRRGGGWDGWMASLTRWHECEWTPVVSNGQGGLVSCNSWGCKESDTTERLNWTEGSYPFSYHKKALKQMCKGPEAWSCLGSLCWKSTSVRWQGCDGTWVGEVLFC